MKLRLIICLLFVGLGLSALCEGQQAGAPAASTAAPAASTHSGGRPAARQPSKGRAGWGRGRSTWGRRYTARRRVYTVRRPAQTQNLRAQQAAQAEKARKESAAKAAAQAAKTNSSPQQTHQAVVSPPPSNAAAGQGSAARPATTSTASAPTGQGAAGAVAKSAPTPSSSSGATKSSSPAAASTAVSSAKPSAAAKPGATAPGVAAVSRPADPLLSQAKPDLPGTAGTSNLDHTLESPLSAVGDSWRMIAYLLPTLLVIVVCLNLLRRYQQRNGQLPGFLQAAAQKGGRGAATLPKPGGVWNALLGSFHLNNARESGGSSIRLVESVPVGGVNLHLVQVRGRLLLLGASGGAVSVLTEFREQEGIESEDFRVMLQAAAADIDELDIESADLPVSAVVSSLDDVMRETGESVQRRIRRLRTVQEAEDAVD